MHEVASAPMHEVALTAILEVADEGFIVFDAGHRCTLAGRRIGEIFGVERGALLGGPEADVLALLASACEEPESFLDVVKDPSAACVGELDLKRPTLRIVQLRTQPLPDGWIAIARDVTRERSAERRSHQLLQRLEQITATDALTQLPNRRRFVEELEREHGRAARAWDSYAVLRIDVDDLARVNDEQGIPRGDEVLEQIAERLREGRREYDLLARWGGDEFILLIPGADGHGTRVVAQRMADAVARAPIDLGEKVDVSVSIGAAVWVPPSGESSNDVLERAAEALDLAKRTGKQGLAIDEREPNKSAPPPASRRSTPPQS
ncbi:MAG: diguanylate cyclase [Deltaproteobacteria bacterium]|nr:diguanylate cyclase [Deltaproteobacteria bacterium]